MSDETRQILKAINALDIRLSRTLEAMAEKYTPDWVKVKEANEAVHSDAQRHEVQFEEIAEIATKLHGAGKIEEAKSLLVKKYGYDTVDEADESQYPQIKADLLALLD